MGRGAIAMGQGAFAMGQGAGAMGRGAIAMGQGAFAMGQGAFARGQGARAGVELARASGELVCTRGEFARAYVEITGSDHLKIFSTPVSAKTGDMFAITGAVNLYAPDRFFIAGPGNEYDGLVFHRAGAGNEFAGSVFSHAVSVESCVNLIKNYLMSLFHSRIEKRATDEHGQTLTIFSSSFSILSDFWVNTGSPLRYRLRLMKTRRNRKISV